MSGRKVLNSGTGIRRPSQTWRPRRRLPSRHPYVHLLPLPAPSPLPWSLLRTNKLPDPTAFPGPGDPAFGLKIIAPAFTILFVPKASSSFPSPPATPDDLPESNIPAGTPYADLITPDTVVLISQPAGQKCAVVGGIMATRMAKLGARALVVDGRVRDMSCLRGVAQEGGCPVSAA